MANVNTYKLKKRVEPVKGCRKISKADMKLNDVCPDIHVDPETYVVTVDGEKVEVGPVDEVALGRRYLLF